MRILRDWGIKFCQKFVRDAYTKQLATSLKDSPKMLLFLMDLAIKAVTDGAISPYLHNPFVYTVI